MIFVGSNPLGHIKQSHFFLYYAAQSPGNRVHFFLPYAFKMLFALVLTNATHPKLFNFILLQLGTLGKDETESQIEHASFTKALEFR